MICGDLGSIGVAVAHLWYSEGICVRMGAALMHTDTVPHSVHEEMKCSVCKVRWISFTLSSRWLLAGLAAFSVNLVVAKQSAFAQ